jgi:hypothetical protein
MNRYKAYCYAQPVSHFDQSAPQKQFCQRYWVYADSYRPGGPIFINDGGEGASDGMFSPGIVTWQWAQKFNGIYIAIEHRYYGWSVPVPDCSTDNLRFLNNKEALQDNAEVGFLLEERRYGLTGSFSLSRTGSRLQTSSHASISRTPRSCIRTLRHGSTMADRTPAGGLLTCAYCTPISSMEQFPAAVSPR